MFQSRQTSLDLPIPQQAVLEVQSYLASPLMVCGPGRHAIKSGDLPVVPLPLEVVSNSCNPQGFFPEFIRTEELRFVLRWELRRLVAENLPGMVFVSNESPRTHTAGYNRTWALWREIALVAKELSSGQSEDPLMTAHLARIVAKKSHSNDVIALKIGSESRELFLTTMAPTFDPVEGKPHARYAPHFCVAVVTKESLAALHPEAYQAASRGIITETLERSAVPYNPVTPYPHPARSDHLHPFTKHGFLLLARLTLLSKKLVHCQPLEFLHAYVTSALKEGVANEGNVGQLSRLESATPNILDRLAKSHILNPRSWAQLKWRFFGVGSEEADTSVKKERQKSSRKCPFH